MATDLNYLKKAILTLALSADERDAPDLGARFYSYDKQSGKFIIRLIDEEDQPIDLSQFAIINMVMAPNSDISKGRTIVPMQTEDPEDGVVSVILPDNIRQFNGTIIAGVVAMNADNIKTHDFGYFRFEMQQSLIDANIENLPDFYVGEFEQLREQVHQIMQDILNDIDAFRLSIDSINSQIQELQDKLNDVDYYSRAEVDSKVNSLISGKADKADLALTDSKVANLDSIKADKADLALTDSKVADLDSIKADKTFVDAQLAETMQQKADKTEVETAIANMGSASPKGAYATLSALQTAYPNGTTGIYVVTGDGKWYYWSGSAWTAGGQYQSTGIADKSVKSRHIDAIVKTANLFDKNAITTTTRFDGLVVGTTTLNDSKTWSSFYLSGVIELEQTVTSIKLVSNESIYTVACYGADGILVAAKSPTASGEDFVYNFVNASTPIKFIRFESQNTTLPDNLMLCIDTLPTEYVEYGSYIKLNGSRLLTYSEFEEVFPIDDNTFFGLSAGDQNTGDFNTAVGYEALKNAGATNFATAIGYRAMLNNAPNGTVDSGLYNTAVGYQAMMSNIVGHHNTAVGWCAMLKNIGAYNTAIGEDAMYENTTGENNTAVGVHVLKKNTTGNTNIAIGNNALGENTAGFSNVGVGASTGRSNFGSVGAVTTDDRMTLIGTNASVDKSVNTGTFTNATALGHGALVDESNTVQLGNAGVQTVKTHGSYETRDTGDGFICKSPDGSRWLLTPDNSGNSIWTKLV